MTITALQEVLEWKDTCIDDVMPDLRIDITLQGIVEYSFVNLNPVIT